MKKMWIASLLALGCVCLPGAYAEEEEVAVATEASLETEEASAVAKNEVPAKDCGCTKKPKG